MLAVRPKSDQKNFNFYLYRKNKIKFPNYSELGSSVDLIDIYGKDISKKLSETLNYINIEQSTLDSNIFNFPSKSLDILKKSNHLKFLNANDIFNKSEINKSMTIKKFIKKRIKSNIPIEDLIIKERYD